MLKVNGIAVPESSRTSTSLKAYNAKGNRLELAHTTTLRLQLADVPPVAQAFCSKCGAYVPVSQLSVWFVGEDSMFYTCGCKEA